jgi:acylglycerol lipase
MIHERITYARPEAGGETVAHRYCPAHQPRALVLAAHGAGNDALFAFPGIFKQLLERGFEVFSFDMDGHGRESTTRFAYPAVAGAIPAALEQAVAGRRDLPVHALGVSLGGSVLLSSLPGLGGAIVSAVLITAPLRIRFGVRRVLSELRPSLLGAWLRQREHCGLWGLVPSFGPIKRGVYPLRLAEAADGSFGYIEVLNDALARMQLERAAGQLRLPVLMVYGTADRIVPPILAEELAQHMPDAEIHWVEGGTHLTTLFDEAALARIFQWLECRTPPSVK